MGNRDYRSWFSCGILIATITIAVSAYGQDDPDQIIPSTGDTFPAFASIDDHMIQFMKLHKVPGAALCIAKGGKVVYTRGFGYADIKQNRLVQPDSLFRIADLSKPLTAAAVLQLAQRRRINLKSNPFVILGYVRQIRRPDADPRLRDITILHLLQHTAGWAVALSFDPLHEPERIAKAMKISSPPSADAIVEFMLTQPLQFEPGSRYADSNFGYFLLGRIIEKRSGQTYEQYVKKHVLEPLGVTSMRLAGSLPSERALKEVRYYDTKSESGPALQDSSSSVPTPYIVDMSVMGASEGWIASAEDLVKFTASLTNPKDDRILNLGMLRRMYSPPDGPPGHNPNGKPKPWFYGCGWYVRPQRELRFHNWHLADMSGSSALLVHLSNDLSWAVLFNIDRSGTNGNVLDVLIDKTMYRAVAGVTIWPD